MDGVAGPDLVVLQREVVPEHLPVEHELLLLHRDEALALGRGRAVGRWGT